MACCAARVCESAQSVAFQKNGPAITDMPMLTSFIDRCCRCINLLIALALAVMVLLVFGNVVLRYAFNLGISVSEELSREGCSFGSRFSGPSWRCASMATWALNYAAHQAAF